MLTSADFSEGPIGFLMGLLMDIVISILLSVIIAFLLWIGISVLVVSLVLAGSRAGDVGRTPGLKFQTHHK